MIQARLGSMTSFERSFHPFTLKTYLLRAQYFHMLNLQCRFNAVKLLLFNKNLIYKSHARFQLQLIFVELLLKCLMLNVTKQLGVLKKMMKESADRDF